MSEREHFASSLGNWAPVTQGSAAAAQNDSRALFTHSGGSAPQAAFIYRALPHAKDHIFACCVRNDQNAPAVQLLVLNKATAPIAEPGANLTPITCFSWGFATVGSLRVAVVRYRRQADGTERLWDDATLAFVTSGAVGSVPSGQNDSSVILGYQWDVTNQRVRFFEIGAGSGSSPIEACGHKLFCLTDWVAFSELRDSGSSTLWIVLGRPNNDVALTGTYQVEWTRIEDGPKFYVGANQANAIITPYDIKLWESYGKRFWLPSGASPQRTAIICGPGTQPWCSAHTQLGAGIREHDGTLWFFFTGKSATHNSVGVTKSTDNGVTWTPYASNPIIQQVTGTNLQNCSNLSVIKDVGEPDPAKRYKLLATFNDASGNNRIFLYTASTPQSTWTQQGILIGPDVDSATGYSLTCNPIFHKYEWWLINAFGWAWHGPRLAVGSLTKQPFVLGLAPSTVSQVPSVFGSTSRTVTVPNSAGYVEDAMVQIADNTAGSEWAINRVRKNLSSTQFELYERTPGYSAGTAVINRWDAGACRLSGVYYDPERREWCFYASPFKIMDTQTGGGLTGPTTMQASGLAVSSGPLTPPTWDWFDTPQVLFARNNNTGTSENLKFFDPPNGEAPLHWVRSRRRRELRLR